MEMTKILMMIFSCSTKADGAGAWLLFLHACTTQTSHGLARAASGPPSWFPLEIVVSSPKENFFLSFLFISGQLLIFLHRLSFEFLHLNTIHSWLMYAIDAMGWVTWENPLTIYRPSRDSLVVERTWRRVSNSLLWLLVSTLTPPIRV